MHALGCTNGQDTHTPPKLAVKGDWRDADFFAQFFDYVAVRAASQEHVRVRLYELVKWKRSKESCAPAFDFDHFVGIDMLDRRTHGTCGICGTCRTCGTCGTCRLCRVNESVDAPAEHDRQTAARL